MMTSGCLLPAFALLCSGALASAANLTLIGSHPTSPLTAYPQIHNLKAYNGRIYMGYGDYNQYPAVVIASFDPVAGLIRLEHSAGTDSIDTLRVLNGRLYAPAVDPIHYDDGRDLSFLGPGLGWRERGPIGSLHSYDITQAGGRLYLCGSHSGSQESIGGTFLARSSDGGATWTMVRRGGGPTAYWCFALGNRVHVQDGWWEEGVGFTASSVLNAHNYLHDATQVPGTPFAVALSGRSPGIAGNFGATFSLISFDGAAVRTLRTGVRDFAMDGATLFTLEAGGIFRSTALSAQSATMAATAITSPGSGISLEVAGGVAFVGALYGELLAGRLDGQPYAPGAVTTVNELPDSFGRALAFDGARLAVGAPDFSSPTVPLAGRGSLWSAPPPWTGEGFQQTDTFDPTNPVFSAWFAKDMALDGDLLAVLEAGHDTTRADRGSAARVHLLQQSGAAWMNRATLAVPFAHSVAMTGGMLLVGTGNPAASQTPGRPGVNPYVITRAANGVASLTSQPQLIPTLAAWGYKPVVDVALDGDLLAAGYAGDPSREGGRGMCSVYRRTPAGNAFSATAIFEVSPGLADRFGYSVALHAGWLAVGAPRDDSAASQAGAVFLYERTASGGSFTFRQKLVSPVAQPEAEFGAAVALRHDTMLIGSPGLAAGGTPRAGAVHRYRRIGGVWTLEGQLPRPAGSDADFGFEVAVGDHWMAAGSRVSRPGALAERLALAPIPTAFGAWAASRGLAGAASAPEADADEDGVVNLVEYISQLDPLAPDAAPYYPAGPARGLPSAVADLDAADPALIFTYLRPADDPRLVCTIEASQSLSAWAPTAVAPISITPQGAWQAVKVRVSPPTGAADFFVRLRATYP